MCRDFRKYLTLIKKTAYHYRDIEDAEQEAWLCYCEAANDYDPDKCHYFASYLKQKLRWHFKALIRDKQRQTLTYAAACESAGAGSLLEASVHADLAANAKANLDRLPARTRRAVELIRSGNTLSDTARIMNVRPQTISGLLKRAHVREHSGIARGSGRPPRAVCETTTDSAN